MKSNTAEFSDIDCNQNVTFFWEGLDFESYSLTKSYDCGINKSMVNSFNNLNVSSVGAHI